MNIVQMIDNYINTVLYNITHITLGSVSLFIVILINIYQFVAFRDEDEENYR